MVNILINFYLPLIWLAICAQSTRQVALVWCRVLEQKQNAESPYTARRSETHSERKIESKTSTTCTRHLIHSAERLRLTGAHCFPDKTSTNWYLCIYCYYLLSFQFACALFDFKIVSRSLSHLTKNNRKICMNMNL